MALPCGALLFLNAEAGLDALNAAANFLQERLESSGVLSAADINNVLDTLASADMLIDNLKNRQPVLHAMFKVALASSGKLKSAA